MSGDRRTSHALPPRREEPRPDRFWQRSNFLPLSADQTSFRKRTRQEQNPRAAFRRATSTRRRSAVHHDGDGTRTRLSTYSAEVQSTRRAPALPSGSAPVTLAGQTGRRRRPMLSFRKSPDKVARLRTKEVQESSVSTQISSRASSRRSNRSIKPPAKLRTPTTNQQDSGSDSEPTSPSSSSRVPSLDGTRSRERRGSLAPRTPPLDTISEAGPHQSPESMPTGASSEPLSPDLYNTRTDTSNFTYYNAQRVIANRTPPQRDRPSSSKEHSEATLAFRAYKERLDAAHQVERAARFAPFTPLDAQDPLGCDSRGIAAALLYSRALTHAVCPATLRDGLTTATARAGRAR